MGCGYLSLAEVEEVMTTMQGFQGAIYTQPVSLHPSHSNAFSAQAVSGMGRRPATASMMSNYITDS